MRHVYRAALCIGATALISVGVAGPAAADSSNTLYTIWPDRRAHASFTSYDEIFKVSDDEGDGASAIVYWNYTGGATHTCTNSKGAGTTKTCDLDLPENRTIHWQLCTQSLSGGGAVYCSKERTDTT
ncbi:hypothetical protein CLV35_1135 [Motilibacter peucedani]|uniref:Secreted protein n=1 Tax=Motilibacter peucedani TaxID=598650 RepID=A0A420XRK9_9ACTN|nr:hypothetical protein [Motilibacter peucedani]RKS77449.1 hypothetical protein CLV35_1135 [Motilibacter peucedani]